MGTLTLLLRTSLIERKVNLQVLGRPYIHDLKAKSSSVHHKVVLEVKGNVSTLNASQPKTKIYEKALILIEQGDTDEDPWGFNTEIEPIEAEPM